MVCIFNKSVLSPAQLCPIYFSGGSLEWTVFCHSAYCCHWGVLVSTAGTGQFISWLSYVWRGPSFSKGCWPGLKSFCTSLTPTSQIAPKKTTCWYLQIFMKNNSLKGVHLITLLPLIDNSHSSKMLTWLIELQMKNYPSWIYCIWFHAYIASSILESLTPNSHPFHLDDWF